MTFMLLKKSGFNNIKIPYSNLHSSKVASAYRYIQMRKNIFKSVFVVLT